MRRGALAGSPSAGFGRTPVRASAPAAPSLPGERAAGSTVRPDDSPTVAADGSYPGMAGKPFPQPGVSATLPVLTPGQGGPQLTAATGGTPSPVAAVDQPRSTS